MFFLMKTYIFQNVVFYIFCCISINFLGYMGPFYVCYVWNETPLSHKGLSCLKMWKCCYYSHYLSQKPSLKFPKFYQMKNRLLCVEVNHRMYVIRHSGRKWNRTEYYSGNNGPISNDLSLELKKFLTSSSSQWAS